MQFTFNTLKYFWKVLHPTEYVTFLHIFHTTCMLLKFLSTFSPLLLFSMSSPPPPFDHIYSSWAQRVNWLHVVMETLLRSCIASLVMKTDRPCWGSGVSWTSPSLSPLGLFSQGPHSSFVYMWVREAKITHCTLLLYTKTVMQRERCPYTWRLVRHNASLLKLSEPSLSPSCRKQDY